MAKRMLFADTGTTFTKTCLLEHRGQTWRILERAVAPTTVDSPNFDVMVGLKKAIAKLESWTGIKLLSEGNLDLAENEEGTGQFAATSSAGGGLQVLVAGLTEQITAESGHRAALGAGAVVTDIVSLTQASTDLKSLERVRNVPCDMVLVTGGTDGGNVADVLALAEFLSLAAPKPRFGTGRKTPLIFAGNVEARSDLKNIIGDTMDLMCIDNIRPTLERESLQPVRDAIQNIFLKHVMSGAPGFKNLALWTQDRVKPTPVALGTALIQLAQETGRDIIAVDVGGATTDVFSVIKGQFYRSVSASLGMSHSMGSILDEVHPEKVSRWLPWEQNDTWIRNWHLNKVIRPSTLPQTVPELMLEQCFAKEAINLSLHHHRAIATGLKGIKISREIGDVFTQYGTGHTLVNLLSTAAVVGLGGVISNVPRPSQALSVIIDGIQPEGITDILIDNGSFLPYAGLLATNGSNSSLGSLPGIKPLMLMGTCIAPVGPRVKDGTVMAKVTYGNRSYQIVAGQILVVAPADSSEEKVLIEPNKEFDLGEGKGSPVTKMIPKSKLGLVLDGRGRPLTLPKKPSDRILKLARWYAALDAYPESALRIGRGD